MTVRRSFRIAAALGCCAGTAIHAQSPVEPTAYTVQVRYEITGAAVRTTYRLGTKVLVDQVPSAGVPPSGEAAAPTRTLYFLDTGQSLSWEPGKPDAACTRGSFQGDAWLDPFSGAADLAMPGVTQIGSETVHGVAAAILVVRTKPGMKLWVDPKTGLMLKAEFTPPSGTAMRYFEVTEVRLEAPPGGVFEVPARCGGR